MHLFGTLGRATKMALIGLFKPEVALRNQLVAVREAKTEQRLCALHCVKYSKISMLTCNQEWMRHLSHVYLLRCFTCSKLLIKLMAKIKHHYHKVRIVKKRLWLWNLYLNRVAHSAKSWYPEGPCIT
jgi:hypothetical protein